MASDLRFLSVRNLEKYQHYKHRNPPWVKWHLACLDDPTFTSLPDAVKWLAVGMVMLASRTDNKIPASVDWIKGRLFLKSEPDLKKLVDSDFLVDASNMLATCTQPACSESESERESETEKDMSEPAALTLVRLEAKSTRNAATERLREWESMFDQWWEKGPPPRKIRKVHARAAWRKLLPKNGVTATEKLDRIMVLTAKRWANDWERAPRDKRPHAATFLNGEEF